MKRFSMSSFSTLVAILATFCTSTLLLFCSCQTVYASELSGSDGRPIYTEEERPNFPVFNSVEGEENFLWVISPDNSVAFGDRDTLELQLDQEYRVSLAYCNDGIPAGVTSVAIANDVRARIELPPIVNGESQIIGSISAVNAQPETVSCALTLFASEPMHLVIEPGSIRIVNNNKTNNELIAEEDFLSAEGAMIGTNSMSGIVLYGSENAGRIEFVFRTVSSEAQPSATPKPTAKATPTPINETTPSASPEVSYSAQENSEIAIAFLAICATVLIITAAIGAIMAYIEYRK